MTEWIGDNFCDDINNNEKCLYDDGDCCGLSAQKNFCFKCTCKGKLEHRFNKVLTLPVKMFGPFWSVWCKTALAEVGLSLP